MLERKLPASADFKRHLVDTDYTQLSIRRQCELLDLNRSTYYLQPAVESEENLRLMRLIDQPFLLTPFYVDSGQKLSHYRGQIEPSASLPGEFFGWPVLGFTCP